MRAFHSSQSRAIVPGDSQRAHRARRFAGNRNREEVLGAPLLAALDQNLTRGANFGC